MDPTPTLSGGSNSVLIVNLFVKNHYAKDPTLWLLIHALLVAL